MKFTHTNPALSKVVIVCILTMAGSLVMAQNVNHWVARGTNPEDYQMGGDPTIDHGSGEPAYIFSKVDSIDGFGTLTGKIPIEEFIGKRIKLSAYVKTENVKNWVGLWLRADGKDSLTSAFDNMQDRMIKGTTDWQKYNIVLDIPKESAGMFGGLLMDGTGKAWFDGLTLGIVGTEVPVTRGMSFDVAYMLGEYQKGITDLEHIIKSKVMPEQAEYFKIWYYIMLRKDNQTEKAKQYLSGLGNKPIKSKWSPNIIKYLQGSMTDDEFLSAANTADEKKQKEQKCEAYYYAGINNLFQGNREKARICFEYCLEHKIVSFVEPNFAKAELERMK